MRNLGFLVFFATEMIETEVVEVVVGGAEFMSLRDEIMYKYGKSLFLGARRNADMLTRWRWVVFTGLLKNGKLSDARTKFRPLFFLRCYVMMRLTL